MNSYTLRVCGAAAGLAFALSGCGAPSDKGGANGNNPPAPEASMYAPTPEPFRLYSSDELSAVIGSVRDSRDTPLEVMNADKLAETAERVRSNVREVEVEPVECEALATGRAVFLDFSTHMAIGVSTGSSSKATYALTLLSGMTKEKLDSTLADRQREFTRCADLQLSALGLSMTATTEVLESAAKTPGTVSARTIVHLPFGGQQSIMASYAIKSGVMIGAQGIGTELAAADQLPVEALLDQAAELIK